MRCYDYRISTTFRSIAFPLILPSTCGFDAPVPYLPVALLARSRPSAIEVQCSTGGVPSAFYPVL